LGSEEAHARHQCEDIQCFQPISFYRLQKGAGLLKRQNAEWIDLAFLFWSDRFFLGP
jgi:hypothetical protein